MKEAAAARGEPPILQRPPEPTEAVVVARFGDILGKRFTRDNMALLGQAYAAYAGLKKSAALIRGHGANIFTQWSGDPDALGSAVMLEAILRELGAHDVRILTGSLGHPQNRNLVEKCRIVLRHPNHERIARGLHCTVDTSPPLGMSNTGPVEPVREFFFVADHHADPEEVEQDCRSQGVRAVKLAFVGLPMGSTSTFLSVIAAAFGLLESVGPEGRAAAALGIYTDTSALLHATTPLDFQMFELLTRDEATEELLDDLRDYRVPPEWFDYRTAAFTNLERRGGVRIAPVGYVPDEHRDVIAEIANDLLRVEGTSIAIVVAVTQRGTEVSVRADSRLLGEDRERIVSVIDHLLENAFPGLSGFKYERRPPHRVEGGAFVPHSPDEARKWASGGPEGAAVEHSRGITRALVTALEAIKDERPEEIQGLI
jgi:nanoRNase/pAp phosphatase (c-di-AMP/oligoRNAs hydrolase)